MMIDWTSIVITIIGFVGGGAGVGAILHYRSNKAGSTADALSKYNDMTEKILDNTLKQQDVFNKIIEDKDLMIAQQGSLIVQYKASLEEANRKLSEFELTIVQNKRKIEGVQREYTEVKAQLEEMKKKLEATDKIKCTLKECELREPPLKI